MSDRRASLRDEIVEAYDTHCWYSILPDPPDRPLIDHWQEKGTRVARVFLGMQFLPVALFRIRDYLLHKNVPILPYLCELLSRSVWRVSIGRSVKIGPRLIIPHGKIVIDGMVTIGRHCAINPWVTIGLRRRRGPSGLDSRGPNIGDHVYIGTGAKVLGPITIGNDALIGANAVVIEDVPAGATAVGAPARIIQFAPPDSLDAESS